MGPTWEAWKTELIKWAKAEGTVLHRETVRGMRHPDIEQAWDGLMVSLEWETTAGETEEANELSIENLDIDELNAEDGWNGNDPNG